MLTARRTPALQGQVGSDLCFYLTLQVRVCHSESSWSLFCPDLDLFICISLEVLIKIYGGFIRNKAKKIQLSLILNPENSFLVVFEALTLMSYSDL